PTEIPPGFTHRESSSVGYRGRFIPSRATESSCGAWRPAGSKLSGVRYLRQRLYQIRAVRAERQNAESQVEPPPQSRPAHVDAAASGHAVVQGLGGVVALPAHAERDTRERRDGSRLDRRHLSEPTERELREDQLLLQRRAEALETVEPQADPHPQPAEMASQ